MATSSDQVQLLESSEDSFEEMLFEEYDDQLIGVATANYIPMESDEILCQKGKYVLRVHR